MKKIVSVLFVLLCVCAAFAGTFKPYLQTLDLHPAILSGWCPTYIGLGANAAFPLANGDTIHADFSMAGGITERALFQDAGTGDYITIGESKVCLMDIVSVNWDLKGVYDLGECLEFTAGYLGRFEARKDSMLVTGKYWPKKESTKRWIGGTEKETPELTINDWLYSFETDDPTAVYPEMGSEYSVFHTLHTEVKFDKMTDTMVANDGFLALFKLNLVPGLLNKDANMFSANFDVIAAKTFVDIRSKKDLNLFAISIIDRFDFNFTFGTKVPTYFQQSISLGRKVRGFDTGSYASNFTAVNNFEVRLSGPEPIKGVFLRTNFFFDCGLGFGGLFNSDFVLTKPNFLASVGVQEQIDYNDAFDLGIEVAYLLHGTNMKNPYSKLQVGATFFLDF